MAKHNCADCKWTHSFFDSRHSVIDICVFIHSENYLQEVDLCSEDENCCLDDFAENIWQRDHMEEQ